MNQVMTTVTTPASLSQAHHKLNSKFKLSTADRNLCSQHSRSSRAYVRRGVLGPCEVRASSRAPEPRKHAQRTPTASSAMATEQATNDAAPSLRSQMPRRAVITGLGVVSPLGHDADEFYDNLLAGKSGVKKITGWDPEAVELSTTFAAEITDFEPGDYISKKMARRLDPYIKYILVASKKALEYAGLYDPNQPDHEAFNSLDKLRCGAMVGSAMGGYQTFSTAIEALMTKGPRKMNPFCIPFAITNMGSALLAMDLGFMGPNYSAASACATGSHCILAAAQHIQRGECDVMLAGAADACVLPIGMAGFASAQALSKRNDDPEHASRPWDTERDGFVMGEGAGVLCIEELEHAKARGATIYAEVLGGAFNCDAHHMTNPNPSGQGVSSCISQALINSGVGPSQVSYVNAHATSTPAGDLAEYRALKAALPGSNFKMNASKSMLGHSLGAAGAVEAVAVVKAIFTGKVHPNINITSPEEELDLNDIVGPTAEDIDIDVAISNSFGFGGNNACLVFAPYKP